MHAKAFSTIAGVALAAFLSACAITGEKVPIDFVPASTPRPLAGAAGVVLTLVATDNRTRRQDRISTEKNGWNGEMASIEATNDVVELVRDSLGKEFKIQGFTLGANGLPVAIQLMTFYNDFNIFPYASTTSARVTFAIRVGAAGSAPIYTQLYNGTYDVGDIHFGVGRNAKDALEKALGLAVKNAVDDVALQRALLSGSTPAAASPRRL